MEKCEPGMQKCGACEKKQACEENPYRDRGPELTAQDWYAPLLKDAQALIQQQEQEIKRLRQDKEELLREVNRKVTISVGHGAGWEYYFRKYKGVFGRNSLERAIKRDLKEQLIEFCDDHGYIVYRQENARLIEDGEKLTASMTVLLPQGVERTLPDGIAKIKEEGYHGAGEAADLHGGNDGSAESAAGGQAGNAGGAHAGHCGGREACQCDREEKRVREE